MNGPGQGPLPSRTLGPVNTTFPAGIWLHTVLGLVICLRQLLHHLMLFPKQGRQLGRWQVPGVDVKAEGTLACPRLTRTYKTTLVSSQILEQEV
jgi:hypothetical protein